MGRVRRPFLLERPALADAIGQAVDLALTENIQNQNA